MDKRSHISELTEGMVKRLIYNSQDFICIAGMDGYFRYINPAMEKTLGYSRKELLSKPFLDFIHPDDHVKNDQEVGHLADGQLTFDFENRYVCKDSSVRHIQWTATLEIEEHMMYCIGRDITSHKQAEQKILQTEKEFSQIFSMSLDMICIADNKTATFLKVNPAFTEVLGHSEKDLLAKSYLDFVHPDDIEATLAIIDQKIKIGAKIINFENRYRCKDGSYRWLSWVSQPDTELDLSYAIARDITEKKRNEAELTKSKEILEATNRMARVGGWELDLTTQKVLWTEMTVQIHDLPEGYVPHLEEAINYYHPDDSSMVADYVSRAMEKGLPFDFEARLITEKKRLRWVHAIGEPTMVDGKCVRLRGTFQDITDRKQAEEEKERILNLSQDLICIAGLDGYFRYVNPAFENILGYKKDEMVGRFILEFVHPDDHDKTGREGEKLKSGINSIDFENRYICKNGSIRDIQWTITPVLAENLMYCIGRDITDHKQMVVELLEKETQYRNLADSGLALIWTSGLDKLCNYFNEPWLNFTGRSLEEEMGNGWTEGVHPDDFDHCLDIYTTAFDNREAFEMEYRLQHVSGEYRWIQDLGTPNYDSAGKFIGYIGHCFDITEQINAKDAIKKNLEEKETLIRELYHRTKNTLQVIHSMLLIHADQYTDNEDVQKLVKDMESRILTIALVQQKLYQSQDLSRLNLTEYLHELANLIMTSYIEAAENVTLSIEGDETIPILLDTAIPCGLIVNELLTNALKYAFPDSRKGEISIRIFRKTEARISISYSDTGIGVPEEFDFRDQPSLGLQTIFAIVEQQMRGSIAFSCKQGVSCLFEFPDALYKERV